MILTVLLTIVSVVIIFVDAGRWTDVRSKFHVMLNLVSVGPLQLTVTWYKIHLDVEQVAHWDIQNKENSCLTG